MDFGPYRFSPPWWGVLLFCLGAVIFSALGTWQIERAHYKQRLVTAQQSARAAPPAAIETRDDDDALVYGQKYYASGRFDPDQQILLADQTYASQVGYRVWTALRLDGGTRVMVDRGWIERSNAHTDVPDPPVPGGRVTVQGTWHRLPSPALNWGAASACGKTGWPRVLSYPEIDDVRCQYDGPVLNGLLLLDPEAPDGFVRDWADEKDTVGLRPFGHYAYASQWFLMAVVAGIIFVVVNLRRR